MLTTVVQFPFLLSVNTELLRLLHARLHSIRFFIRNEPGCSKELPEDCGVEEFVPANKSPRAFGCRTRGSHQKSSQGAAENG